MSSDDDRLSWVDKQVSQAMDFHFYAEKRAAAMELWIIIHVAVVAGLLLFTDWIVVPVLLVANALVIAYQRYKLEPELVAIENQRNKEV